MKHLIFFAFSILLTALPAQAQTLRAPPVDEAAQNPGFVAYRTALINAVVRRDIDAVLKMSAPDIHLSFGGAAGRDQFREFLEVDPVQLAEEYKHEAPRMRAENWAALETVLRMGGQFTDTATFVAPYTWTFDLPEDVDAFAAHMVTGNGVVLRDRPIRFGAALARLDHDVVLLRERAVGTSYSRVETMDGTMGYVHVDFLRAYVDFRAIFHFDEGIWLMTTFIAGD